MKDHDCLQIILKCWNEKKKWNYKSQYWTFNDVIVEPPCTQKPHPPIWMAAGHPDSIKTCLLYTSPSPRD